MKIQANTYIGFDSELESSEQLPRTFEVVFKEMDGMEPPQVQVFLNGQQVGDIINDNSYKNDFYRYHDVFHYTFATFLGWSPCVRSMLRKKRKSNPLIDRVEDGARATITEEAISLLIFGEASKNNFFKDKNRISKNLLKVIKTMTEHFEVNVITEDMWEQAILKGYELFRFLISHRGGRIRFNSHDKSVNCFELV